MYCAFMTESAHGQPENESGAPSLQLHHIALGALQVEQLAEFYRRAFRLPEVARHLTSGGSLRSIWLRLGSAVLMIEHTEHRRALVEGLATGPFLLAFSIRPEEREELEARLRELGAPPQSRTEFTSYFRDPEGNRVALSCYPLPLDGGVA